MRLENPSRESVPWRGPEDTPFTESIRNTLVRRHTGVSLIYNAVVLCFATLLSVILSQWFDLSEFQFPICDKAKTITPRIVMRMHKAKSPSIQLATDKISNKWQLPFPSHIFLQVEFFIRVTGFSPPKSLPYQWTSPIKNPNWKYSNIILCVQLLLIIMTMLQYFNYVIMLSNITSTEATILRYVKLLLWYFASFSR